MEGEPLNGKRKRRRPRGLKTKKRPGPTVTKDANFIATELVPDAHRGDFDHAKDVVTQKLVLPQFDVTRYQFCRGGDCAGESCPRLHDQQMVACTTGDLNYAVRGSRPRAIVDCRPDGSRERCVVCDALFADACGKKYHYQLLTVFHAEPDENNVMCFNSQSKVFGAFQLFLRTKQLETADVVIYSGGPQWYDRRGLTHVELTDVFVRRHLDMPAAYLDYPGRPDEPCLGPPTEHLDSTGDMAGQGETLALVNHAVIDGVDVWHNDPLPRGALVRNVLSTCKRVAGDIEHFVPRAIGDPPSSFVWRIRYVWSPDREGQRIACVKSGDEESVWVVPYNLAKMVAGSGEPDVGLAVVAIADAHARDCSHPPGGMHWLRRFEAMSSSIMSTVCVDRMLSRSPPVSNYYDDSTSVEKTKDTKVLKRSIRCGKPFLDERHAGAMPSKMEKVAFAGGYLWVSDTATTKALMNEWDGDSQATDKAVNGRWVRSCLTQLLDMAGHAVEMAGEVAIAADMVTRGAVDVWRTRVICVFDWSNRSYGGFWERERQVLNLAAFVWYVDNGSAYWRMLINVLHELGHCITHMQPDHHGVIFASTLRSLIAELVRSLASPDPPWITWKMKI